MRVRALHPRLRIAALDSFDMEGSRADLIINLINHHPTLSRPLTPQVRYHEGAEYAIIRREFLAARNRARGIPLLAREVLVTFGGADPSNHTGLVLDALAQEPLKDVTVRIVVGPNFSRAGEVTARARALGFETLEKIDRLAPWFSRADLAVSGGGTTMLELACVGTPALVLPQNEAEARFASSLAGLGAVRLGQPASGPAAVRRELDALINDQRARQLLNRCALEAVDGLGQQRIASLLLSTFTPAAS
jgi:spore coat polysaccharide biosynthesis predicted glycosyltransferase SpsG